MQKNEPGILSARVYPLSFEMLHREEAGVFERYLSSRSPPDHLLYQMLKIVPVCGGGSDVKVDGSAWGLAGLLLRRIILVFFWASGSVAEVSEGLVRAVSGDGSASSAESIGSEGSVDVGIVDCCADSTSVMVSVELFVLDIRLLSFKSILIKEAPGCGLKAARQEYNRRRIILTCDMVMRSSFIHISAFYHISS
jgi:hypothetical protein